MPGVQFTLNILEIIQGRRKRGGGGGGLGELEPPNNFYVYKAEQTLRLEKCKPNSDFLKKMKEPRLALSTLLAHMLQAISDSLLSSNQINLFL